MSNSELVLSLCRINQTYRKNDHSLIILKDADLEIRRGELVALIAPSGAGKSTLLHLAGLLEKPDSGSLIISGIECSFLGEDERTRIRRIDIGFVYQFHHLLPDLNALENISFPQRICGKSVHQANHRAKKLLEHLGLLQRAHHRPSDLSGGEQQRVAIARAVANNPKLLLADEPTGNLDPCTANLVFETLVKLVQSKGLSALIATHNHELAARMDRIVTIRNHKIVEIHNY
ncbi:ABC transporter ATP-binding protein [Candidatus Endowatersipora endosymbiont of Watersipora subatra]|uniref:ABC transporter ATP-binding protein n=1 Tax=Candidatus Endowatersipora endosymbiont of Watersipora subatra TaxID=3077946 RepID=UPI00312C8A3C